MILTKFNGKVGNPNKTWDISKKNSDIMKKVYQFENLVNFITIILNFLVLFPITSIFIKNNKRMIK
jgi:hypothetical protein